MLPTGPSPLLLNKGRPSSPCYCHAVCDLQGSQIGTSLCPSTTHPSSAGRQGGNAGADWVRSDASMVLPSRTASVPVHTRVVWGCGKQPEPEPLFVPGRNGGKGKGLLCTKARAAATQVQLPAGDTLGDSGEFIAAGLHFRRVK